MSELIVTLFPLSISSSIAMGASVKYSISTSSTSSFITSTVLFSSCSLNTTFPVIEINFLNVLPVFSNLLLLTNFSFFSSSEAALLPALTSLPISSFNFSNFLSYSYSSKSFLSPLTIISTFLSSISSPSDFTVTLIGSCSSNILLSITDAFFTHLTSSPTTTLGLKSTTSNSIILDVALNDESFTVKKVYAFPVKLESALIIAVRPLNSTEMPSTCR